MTESHRNLVQDEKEQANENDLDISHDHKQNMRSFISKYGVTMDLPSYVVLDANIYPTDSRYCL